MAIITKYAQCRAERELSGALDKLRAAMTFHQQNGNAPAVLWNLVGALTATAKAALDVIGR